MEISKDEMIKIIPSNHENIIGFIKDRNINDYYEKREDELLIIDEVFIGGRQFLIELDLKRKVITFIDDLVHLESVLNLVFNNELDIDLDEWNNSYNNLLSSVKELGLKLFYTGNGGNEDYLWYGLSVNFNDFNTDVLNKCVNLWDEYNISRRSIYENY